MIVHQQKKIGGETFRCVITDDEIKSKIKLCASEIIEKHRKDKAPPVLLSVLMGGLYFTAELSQYLADSNFPHEIDAIRIKSYTKDEKAQAVEWISKPLNNLSHRNVIIVEDVIDKGNSMNFVYEELKMYYPVTIETAALIVKKGHSFKQTITYSCFEGEYGWITGKGLDTLCDGYSLGRGDRDICEKM